jgi:hypothetical protein
MNGAIRRAEELLRSPAQGGDAREQFKNRPTPAVHVAHHREEFWRDLEGKLDVMFRRLRRAPAAPITGLPPRCEEATAEPEDDGAGAEKARCCPAARRGLAHDPGHWSGFHPGAHEHGVRSTKILKVAQPTPRWRWARKVAMAGRPAPWASVGCGDRRRAASGSGGQMAGKRI